ncbi:MAG: hypothetical protein FD135_4146 [Comamonadaceae bacterium]|nr:MAG: hypothetical protein FD135_4146 [Comamonadaceae bacterium]
MLNSDTAPTSRPQASLRGQALRLLCLDCTTDKAAQVHALNAADWPLDVDEILTAPPLLPGRPERPHLVHPSQLKTRAVGTLEGRAGLIHALTHIEANAINLALDMMWRFAGLPADFYLDWWRVAQEEALHFDLLHQHLIRLGFAYGDFPAHDAGTAGAGATHPGGPWPGCHACRAQPAGVSG